MSVTSNETSSTQLAHGIAGSTLQALLAMGEPAHEAIAGITERCDVADRWIIDGQSGRRQRIELAAHCTRIAQQCRGVLDLLEPP